MKVFDIQCSHGHIFEGWFASEADFQGQCARGLVECPFCGDNQVQKRLSAPRLNAKSNQKKTSEAVNTQSTAQMPVEKAQKIWMELVNHVVRNTEDVGENFAQEARRIHYGEAPERGIRGQTTAEQAQELQDEGIDIMSLPMPAGIKGPVQ